MNFNQILSVKQSGNTIVFVDANIQDYQLLLSNLRVNTEFVILHPKVDGIKQITQTLSQYKQIESIYIISHGTPGTLYLGNTQLNLDTLTKYFQELQTWFNSSETYFSPALVLYGCDVAKTDVGTKFLERLHQVTQATVYASSTPVGNFNLGGNWDLDIICGEAIPEFPALIFQPELLETYAGVFGTGVGTGSDSNYTYYDSKEASGKGTVAFTDITSANQNSTTLTIARDQQSAVTLPFGFNFYGTSYTRIIIGENGGIGFVNSTGTAQFRLTNANIPSSSSAVPVNSIFPFWDDLSGGTVHYKQDGDRFIVQWNNFTDESGQNITFQVVLHKDSNNIDFVYDPSTPNTGATASIGFNASKNPQDNTPIGVKYSVDQANLNGVTSIRFVTEPRLTINSLPIKEGETITLTPSYLNAIDVDNSDTSKLTYIINNLQNGEFKVNGTTATTFTQKDINDGKVQFIHNGVEDAPSFKIALSDGFNTSNEQSATINFTNVNDQPVLTDNINSVIFNENSLNTSAGIITSNLTVTDVDSLDFNGGNLTVSYSSGGGIEDQLSLRSNNGITLSVGNVSFNGNIIGNINAVNNGTNGKSLVINFSNTTATRSAVETLIQSLTYQNISDTPAASRTISVTVNDGDGGTSSVVTKIINVTAENDAPVNTIPVTQNINEDETLTFAGNNLISINDVDAGNNPVQVKLIATEGNLSLNGTSGLTFANGSDGIDDANTEFTGTIAAINTALNGMTFKPTTNKNGSASVQIVTNDLGNSPTGANSLDISNTVNININAINDAPINTVPASQQVKEDTDLLLNGSNAIAISDVDAQDSTGETEVKLSVGKGILTLKDTTGLTFNADSGNGKSTVVFRGKITDINTALTSLVYRGNLNANGADTLTVTTSDLGNTGSGGALIDTDTVQITIAPVNDVPINTVPSEQNVSEDVKLVFSTKNSNAIAISDVDAAEGTGKVEVKLSVTQGVLTLAETSGITFSQGDGIGNASMTFSGTVDRINQVLDGLVYLGNQDSNTKVKGEDTLTIVTSDLSNQGEGGALLDTDTVKIKLAAINDAPVNTVPQEQSIDEDTNLVFNSTNKNAISISDIDVNEGTGELEVTLAVTKGVLSLKQATGLTFSQGNGTVNASMTFKGKVTDINNALEGLIYRGNPNANGEDTLSITTNDLGNTGVGASLIDTDTVKIKLNAVNDAPVNTVPIKQSVKEDTDLFFNPSNSISINDIDASESTGETEVKLSVTKGMLTLQETAGLTFKDGNGKSNATMSFIGKVADVNKALASLMYRGNENFHGQDTLTISTNDQGNNGNGGALVDTDAVDITVTPVNDAPVNNVPQEQTVDQYQQLTFSTEEGNAISVSDIDAEEGTGEVEVTLAVTQGVLTLGQMAGITFKAGDGKANATMMFAGKVADINEALNSLVYQANRDFSGSERLTITTSDLGNFGTEDIQIDQDTIGISVIPDFDVDGISSYTEEQVAQEIAKQNPNDPIFKNLSQKAAKDAGIAAIFGEDGNKKPIIIAVNEEDQKRLEGNSQTPALVLHNVTTQHIDANNDLITAFDGIDPKKSSLKKLTPALDIVNFEVMPNPTITDENLQQKIKDGIKQQPVRVEIKLPDAPDDMPINAILKRRADGTLYDFRRQVNPQQGQVDNNDLTGAVLQDRNLDGKADWAVVYLQDGEWSDNDPDEGKIGQSLVAANWDLGTSRMEVRSQQDGLNFFGNSSFVQFTLDRFSGVEASEVGMARVRFGDDGQIIEVNGITVKSEAEAKQAIVERGETLFSTLANKGRNPDFGTQTRTVAVEEGEQAVFFVIQDGTKDELLFNGLDSKPVNFSLPSLNSGKAMMTASNDESQQTAKLSLAGLFDIKAKILTAAELKPQLGQLAVGQSQTQINTNNELIDLKSSGAFDGKQVLFNFSMQREARNNNSAYLFRVDDAKGSIRDSLTGMLLDPTTGLSAEQKQRYLELATSDRLIKDSKLQTANFTTKEVSVNLKGGEYYAPFLVSDGTLGSIGKDFSRILTPYLGINSDRVDNLRSLGTNIFGFEDSIGGSDRDYNDMILSIKQVQVIA